MVADRGKRLAGLERGEEKYIFLYPGLAGIICFENMGTDVGVCSVRHAEPVKRG